MPLFQTVKWISLGRDDLTILLFLERGVAVLGAARIHLDRRPRRRPIALPEPRFPYHVIHGLTEFIVRYFAVSILVSLFEEMLP